MQRKTRVETLLFIPDDILDAYRDEAVRQVAASWARRPLAVIDQQLRAATDAALHPAPTRTHDPLLVFAAFLALIGWTACTAWWTWLALDTGLTLWTTFAGVGAGVLLAGIIAGIRFKPTRVRSGTRRRGPGVLSR